AVAGFAIGTGSNCRRRRGQKVVRQSGFRQQEHAPVSRVRTQPGLRLPARRLSCGAVRLAVRNSREGRMKIAAIDVFTVRLPFRFSFGHSLAARSSSENVVVRVRLSDGSEGWGEGVPRDYVTGEQSGSAASRIADQYAPRFAGLDVSKPEAVLSA